ncbi:hypothetical protein BJF90_15685 [Pseudonocardia sp. CNS-004]|nr:hypothetical protein BJF90_15685 [Pseudonocardia sp. CNS-004]
MIAIESVSRHVADLDAAASFYEALGFARGEARPWGAGGADQALWNTGDREWRGLTMSLPSGVSERQFPLRLREYRGGPRHVWNTLDAWSVGSGHMGLCVEDPYQTWNALANAGELRAQTRGGGPIPMPDEFRAEGERHVERPFATFRDPDGLVIEIQPPRRAHPATPNWVELGDERAGVSHLNLNVPNMAGAQKFFEAIGVEFPEGPFESFAHPWLGNVMGTPPEDGEWTIVYARLPEADGDGAMFSLELIEYHALDVERGYANALLSDANVTMITLRTPSLDDVMADAVAAGGTVYTPGGAVALDGASRAVVLRAPGPTRSSSSASSQASLRQPAGGDSPHRSSRSPSGASRRCAGPCGAPFGVAIRDTVACCDEASSCCIGNMLIGSCWGEGGAQWCSLMARLRRAITRSTWCVRTWQASSILSCPTRIRCSRRCEQRRPSSMTPEHGAWFVTRHEDVLKIYRDLETFSNADIYPTRVPIPCVIAEKVGADYRFPTDKHLNTMDEPEHTRVRKIMTKVFSARRVREREPEVRALANQLVDGFVNGGTVDLLGRYTSPIPTGVVAMLLGTTQEVGRKFRGWVENIFTLTGQLDLPEEEAIKHWNGLIECESWARDLIADHRKRPRDDFTSFMIEAESDDGSPSLSDDEILQQVLSVLLAGSDTSSVAIAETVYRLLAVPERWLAVVDNPALIPAAIEEGMRLASPVRGLHRFVTRDVELGGVLVPAGSDVYFMHSSANRDASVFADPDAFDLERSEMREHLSLGTGARFCLGAPLARLEARVAIETLVERLPDLRLAPDQGELEYEINMIVPILRALEVEWTPSSPA